MIGRSRGAKSDNDFRRTAIQYLEDDLWEPVADTTGAYFEVMCLDEVGLG